MTTIATRSRSEQSTSDAWEKQIKFIVHIELQTIYILFRSIESTQTTYAAIRELNTMTKQSSTERILNL